MSTKRNLTKREAIDILLGIRYMFECSLPDGDDTLILDSSSRLIHDATLEAEEDNLNAMEAIDMAIECIRKGK